MAKMGGWKWRKRVDENGENGWIELTNAEKTMYNLHINRNTKNM